MNSYSQPSQLTMPTMLTILTVAKVKREFCDLTIVTFFMSSGCTGYLQALGVAMNKPMKDRISELIHISYDENFDKLEKRLYQ